MAKEFCARCNAAWPVYGYITDYCFDCFSADEELLRAEFIRIGAEMDTINQALEIAYEDLAGEDI